MIFARRFVSAAALATLIGASLTPIAAAGELLGEADVAELPVDGCSSIVLPGTLPCDSLPIPIEVTVTVEPPVSVATVDPAASTALEPIEQVVGPLPAVEPLEEVVTRLPPVEPLEAVLPAVAELAPPVESVVPPSFSSAPEAVSGPTWSSREADSAPPAVVHRSVPSRGTPLSRGTPPSAAAEPGAATQEPEPVSDSAPRIDGSEARTLATQRSIPTVRLVGATVATPRAGAHLVLGAVGPTAVPLPLAVVAMTPAIGSAAAAAMELARVAGSASIVFNVWLRRQLRERRMSQRQLAAFSGVDHSTISRLLSGARAPSLRTATKLAEALRKLGGPDHAADYFARLSESELFPTKRVEAALLGDDELQDEDVRELMSAYLMLRTRRRRQRLASTTNGEDASDVG